MIDCLQAGAIVGPYDVHLPDDVSDLRWFYVPTHTEYSLPSPIQMRVDVEEDTKIDHKLVAQFKRALKDFGNETNRTDLLSPWRAGLSHLGEPLY